MRTDPDPPTGGNVIYAEDHCGLRWPLMAQVIGWPILLIAASVIVSVSGNPVLAFLPAIALGGTIFAVIATAISRPVGIRITNSSVSIGGVRRQRSSARTGALPPATAQRKQVFSCPWSAVRHIEVATGRERMKELARYRSDRGRLRLGALSTPFMTAALVVQVDLQEASVPEFRPPDMRRSWFRPTRPGPFTVSQIWYAPTRRPVELCQVVAGLVVDAAAPTRPSGPSPTRFL